MKKRILCLAITAILAIGTTMTAYAEDYEGKDGWQVRFDGKKIESNFSSSNMADETANILPGDSIRLKIQVLNSSSGKADFYMSNEVVQTLEDSRKQAFGGAYEYRLSYEDNAGSEKVIYDSETVGGEGRSQGGEGLKGATENLKDYFYLGRLESGKSGRVSLRIKVDGETQDNSYQDTLARLQMNFAAETVTEKTTYGDDRVVKNTVKTTKTVRTGDTSKALLFSVLALISGIVLLILGFRYMKQHRSRKGE